MCSLAFVTGCFLVQSFPHLQTLSLGWIALLGMILLLIISDRDDMDNMLARIEWTTLLFFASMFVLMECVERMGAIKWICEKAENLILQIDNEHRLAAAILIMLSMSALVSSFLDTVPVTAMMVKLIVSLVSNKSLGLPLEPLVWALVFGPSLGGK